MVVIYVHLKKQNQKISNSISIQQFERFLGEQHSLLNQSLTYFFILKVCCYINRIQVILLIATIFYNL